MKLRPLCNLCLFLTLSLVASIAMAQPVEEEVDVRALFGVEAESVTTSTEATVPPVVETPPNPAPVDITPTPETKTPSAGQEGAAMATPALPATPPPEPVAPPPEPEKTWENKKIAILRALDKVTARVQTLEAPVGEVARFGDVFIKVQACREPPAIFMPESAAFLQIWDVPAGQSESRWVFSGWMFATSPALSAMDHPVYDVWVTDCKNPNEAKEPPPKPAASEPPPEEDTPAD